MNVVFVSAEALPYIKVGGLGDVIGSLPYELTKSGHKCSVFLPYYKKINDKCKYLYNIDEETSVYKKDVNGVSYYFIKNKLFDTDNIYGKSEPEDAQRFSVFSKAVVNAVMSKMTETDIIHVHDWHTGFIPIYMKDYEKRPKIIFTIHNLAFQGILDAGMIPSLGLSWNSYNVEELEYYGKINIMKGALVYSDYITTVSRNYAEEIKWSQFGFGLEGVLTKYSHKLCGVVNGLDYELYNPDTDKTIAENYSAEKMDGKKKCKKALIKECGFDNNDKIPVFGFVSRLFGQKGVDILEEAVEKIGEIDIRLVILGSGDKEFEEKFIRLEEKYPDKIKLFLAFDLKLAQRIYAGSDFYLMPSKFEPCGLSQLIAMRYGTIPVVRGVGGLKDTVEDGVTGFVFEEYSGEMLFNTIMRADEIYKNTRLKNRFVKNCLNSDFSWKNSAKEYEGIYISLIR